MKIVLATKNQHKVREIQEALRGLAIDLVSLRDFPKVFLREEAASLRENALQKARITAKEANHWALADDTGLFVEALEGQPGIFSARYAGANATFEQNIYKLLSEMKDIPKGKRRAHFQTFLALVHPDGREVVVDGRLEGVIVQKKKGGEGFGYDPIFFLPERHCTLAEISLEEKNRISHRGQALVKIRGVLEEWLALENRK